MDNLFLIEIVEKDADKENVLYLRSKMRIPHATAINTTKNLIEIGEENQRSSVILANNSMEQSRFVLLGANIISILLGILLCS